MIIGSDGVWQYLSNKEAAEVVYQYYEQGLYDEAAQRLVEVAEQRWKEKNKATDDITCIVVYFQKP